MERTLKNYGWLGNLFLIAICTWLLANWVSIGIAHFFGSRNWTQTSEVPAVLPQPTTLAETPNGKEQILKRNLFSRNLKTPEELSEPAPSGFSGQTAVKTDLKYELLGTVVTPDPAKSIATVRVDKIPKRLHVADKLDGKHDLKIVSRGRIEFYNRDTHRLEFLAFPAHDIKTTLPRKRRSGNIAKVDKGPGIAQTSENEFVIDQAEWEKALANINQILMQARAVPNVTADGKTDGFRVFAIRPGSVYQQLGLRDGDILNVVNGLQIDSITKALGVFENLKSERRFEISLRRNGQPRSFKYEVK